MPSTSACPEVLQFRRLIAGQLTAAEAETLLSHMEGCDACCKQAASVTDQDSLAELVRQSAQAPYAASGEKVSQLIQRLREQVRSNTRSGDMDRTIPPSSQPAPSADTITFRCPNCSKPLRIGANLAGKKVKCSNCQQVMQAPAPSLNVAAEKTLPPSSPSSVTPPPASLAEGKPLGSSQVAGGPVQDADRELLDFLAPAQAPDELGRLGPYRVLKILGAGGMGVVYKAEDPQLKRLVALKAMLPGLGASVNARKRFLREAQAAAAVKHDHVVTIHQVGEDRGAPFLAMEFLQGESLDQCLQREGKLPLKDVLRFGREMAEALDAAHEHGLIHRDIKPANVWLEKRVSGKPRVKILDFGLARAASEEAHLTQSGAIVGTPAYMAPEQAKSKPVDFRCDLFSLGVVLYRMCTGEMPFKGEDTISTLMAVATTDPPPPVVVNFDLPQELSDLVMELLAKDPAARPASARSVVERLEALEEKRPAVSETETKTQAKPKTLATPVALPQTRRRRPLIFGGVAVLLVLLPLAWLFGGTIIRIATNKGELIIESSDPNIEVSVKDGSATIYDKVKDRRFLLSAGDYEVEVREVGGGLGFATKKFTITRGGTETFHARLERPLAKLPDPKENQQPPLEVKKAPITPPEVKKDPVTPPEIKKDPVPPPMPDPKSPVSKEKPPTKVGGTELLPLAERVIALGGKVGMAGYFHHPRAIGPAHQLMACEFPRPEMGPTRWAADLATSGWEGELALSYIVLAFTKDAVTDEIAAKLDWSKVTNVGKLLGFLDLDDTRVGDVFLASLSNPKMDRLFLSQTRVSDAGMENLARLKQLAELHLAGTSVGDAGLAKLAALDKLSALNLRASKITGAGLKHIKNLPLAVLDLSDTAVDDDSLVQLKWLKDLSYVNLRGTKTTPQGIAALRQARPKVFIDADGGGAGSAEDWLQRIGRGNDGGRIDMGAVFFGSGRGLPGPIRSGTANKWVTDANLEYLKKTKDPIREINLQGMFVTGAGLANLAAMDKLTTLRLSGTTLSGAGPHLRKLPNLQMLDVSGRITAAGLKELASLPKLQTLDLSGTAATDSELAFLEPLSQLQQIDVRRTRVTAAGLKVLGAMPKLQTILTDLQPSDETLRALREGGVLAAWVSGNNKGSGASALNLSGSSVTDDGLKELAVLKQMQSLDLSNTAVTDAGLAHLKSMTSLVALHLNGTKVTLAGLKRLKQFKLNSLNVKHLPVSDESLRVVNENGLLGAWMNGSNKGFIQYLDLSGAKITDAGLKELSVAPLVRVIDLSGTAITDVGLAHIKNLTNVKTLMLKDTAITDAGLTHLQSMTALGTLNLSGTKLAGPGLASLEPLDKLGSLDLSNTPIGDGGLAHLKSMTGLVTLNLSGTKVAGPGLANLEPLAKLGSLDLSDTPITDAGLKHVQALVVLPKLILNRTKITDAGLEYLKGLANLRELSLDGTQITEAGFADLRKALPKCKVLGRPALPPIAKNDPPPPVKPPPMPDSKSPGPAEKPPIKAEGADLLPLAEKVVALGGKVGMAAHWGGAANVNLPKGGGGYKVNAFPSPDMGPTQWAADVYRDYTPPGINSFQLTYVVLAFTKDAVTDEVAAKLDWNKVTSPFKTGSFHPVFLDRLDQGFLDLDDTRVGDPFLASLSNPKVDRLFLSQTRVTDAGMESLARQKQLAELHLASTSVGDAGLAKLAALAKLSALNLRASKITGAGLKLIKSLPLAVLDLSDTAVDDDSLVELKWLKNLSYVNLRGTKTTPQGIAALRQARPKVFIDADGGGAGSAEDWLQRIGRGNESGVIDLGVRLVGFATIRWGRANKWVTDANMEYLKKAEVPFHEINLQGTFVTSVGLAHLAGMDKLTTLRLSSTSLSGAGPHLQKLPNLQILDVSGRITAAGLKELASLPKLRTLFLPHNQLSDETLRIMRENGILAAWVSGNTTKGGASSLNLSGSSIADDGLKELAVFKKIQALDLSGTAVTDAGLAHLKSMTSLAALNTLMLKDTAITDAGLAHLQSMTALGTLNLSGTKVAGPGLASLEPLDKLASLDLSDTPITDAGLKQVQALVVLPKLRLNGTKITDAGLEHLKELTNLRELSLKNTQATAAGIAELRKALPKCKIEAP